MANKITALDIGGGVPVPFDRKESRTLSALLQFGLGNAVWTPRDYWRLTEQSYQRNVDVFACISLIAGTAKQIPWMVTTGPEGAAVPESHPLLRLLRNPNERDSESSFKEAAIAYLLLSGNSYIERNGGTETTPPVFLYAHRPDLLRVIKGSIRNMVGGYEYKNGAAPIRFQEWEMLHLRLFNPLDDWYGMSPLESLAYTIDCANEAKALYKKLLQRGFPPGAVSVKGDQWTDEQLRDFKRGVQRSLAASEVLVFGDAEWQEMGFKPIDAALFEGRRFDKRDIAAAFRVPPEMIGDTEHKNYANAREARRGLYTEATIPALTHLRDGLNSWLSPLYNNAYIDFDRDAIDALQEDREVAAKRVSVLWTTSLITRNEGRAELGYDAVPDDEDGYYSEIVKATGSNLIDSQGPSDDSGPVDRTPGAVAGTTRLQLVSADNTTRSRDELGEIKAFNLLSEEQKANHAKALEAQRELWYSRITGNAEDRFSAEANEVLRAFRDKDEKAALRAVTKQEAAWLKFYESTYQSVAEDFGRRVLQSIKSVGYEHECKFELDIFSAVLREWLLSEGAKRVVGILDTTKAQIGSELAAGVSAGESTFQLARRLQAMYADFGNVRAERIARTEVITASAIGSQTAARSTHLPLEKEWLSTPDNRVRHDHDVANGQTRKLDEPYSIGGYPMMHPGDSSMGAPVSEIVLCRCAESYRVSRG